MAKEKLFEWHTFPDLPDLRTAIDDVETVYLIHEEYDYKRLNGKWERISYEAFCLYNWEDHRFHDAQGEELFYDYALNDRVRDYKLYWTVADIPPGSTVAEDILDFLVANGVTPFAEPEPEDWEDDPYYDPDPDRKWKEMHGE